MRHRDPATMIEAWFAEHDGDGEFNRPSRNDSYDLIGPPPRGGRMIYCPKLRTMPFVQQAVPENIGFLGRYGLPHGDDAVWIRRMVGKRELLFLGDLDPVDLLTFAWLRQRLRGVRLRHLGINDSLLNAVGLKPPDNCTILLQGSEKKAVGFLNEAFPDYREVIGDDCTKLLFRGSKLEIEAIISFSPATREGLFDALRP